MSAFAFALVIVAALLHAVWNLVAKHAGGDNRFVLLTAVMIVVVWLPVGVWAAMPGEAGQGIAAWGPLEWGLVLASGVTHLVYFTTLLRGYRASDLTVVYPVARGTGPLLTSVFAVLVLGETLSSLGALGVLGAGVFLIAGGPGLVKSLLGHAGDAAQRARVRAGLLYGLVTGGLIGGYTVIDGYLVKVLLISPILVDYIGNLLRIGFLLPSALRNRAHTWEAWRRQWRHALLVAVISPLAYVLVLYAARMAPLSHVAPAREVSMLFAALLGGRLLGEGDRLLRLAGAACIGLGVAALALG
ncbi:EamA family transporter [Aquabacterium sp. A7-Y]|uniref:EamA family transporter n=1 Tax=Aquabacterium sp. A7-Y TaxID=1349605 RepID=UPI00223E1018|nr:EamA family transporter [Aquabacterium sp. A7-Y]MCW7541527.1 EamA family transporter [Aquabacterium sp. A7-Y]